MKVYRAKKATSRDMAQYHCEDYVNFLEAVTPFNMPTFTKEREHYGVGADCPVFDGLFDFCARCFSAGGEPSCHPVLRDRCQLVGWTPPCQALR